MALNCDFMFSSEPKSRSIAFFNSSVITHTHNHGGGGGDGDCHYFQLHNTT